MGEAAKFAKTGHSLLFCVLNSLRIPVMTPASDSAGWHNAGSISDQDQDQFAYGANTYAQQWAEVTLDGLAIDELSAASFGPSVYATETGGKDSLPIPSPNTQSHSIEPGDYLQLSQISPAARDSIWQGPDAKSSFGRECNFAVQEFIEKPTHAFEIDFVGSWKSNDLEDDLATGEPWEVRDNTRRSEEDQTISREPENTFKQSLLTSPKIDSPSLKPPIDVNSLLETGLRPSFPNVDLAFEPETRRPTRGSKVRTARPHAQPKEHRCDRCLGAFSRAGDLRRHYRVHFPDYRTFHCRFEGCNRNGPRGFYRRDKFRDHQRQAHHFGVQDELVLL